MFCPRCGKGNPEGARYCGRCGARISVPRAGSPPPPASVPSGPPAPAKAPPGAGAGRAAGSAPAGRTGIYAGFWKRFVAYLIDKLVIGAAVLLAIMLFAIIMGIPMSVSGFSEDMIRGIFILNIFTIDIILNWLYFTVMQSSAKQATIGKMVVGIVVTDMRGGRISFARANGRFWSKLISRLIFYIGYVIAGFTDRKQALHDIIADTLVLSRTRGVSSS